MTTVITSRQYHIAASGINKGKYVPCSAQVKCRLNTNHIDHETYVKRTHKNFNDVHDVFKSIDKREITPVVITPKTKTAYRETAVLFGVLGTPGFVSVLSMSSEDYFNAVKEKINPERSGEINALGSISWEKGEMPPELRDAIEANYRLGQKIRAEYYQSIGQNVDSSSLKWVGDDTRYAPADIMINGHLWSLKEKSDIIKNSSAANLLNAILNKDTFSKGMHALDTFAKAEHDDNLVFAVREYNRKNPSNPIPVVKTFEEWCKQPEPVRKSLARFITKESLQKDSEFYKEFSRKKLAVSVKAGNEIINLIKKADLSQVSAGSLLAGDKSYYYAKIAHNKKIDKGYVPDSKTVDTFVKLKKVQHVPGNQLDLRFTYENHRGEELVVQSEVRYSHGQFYGVPESKMKIFKGSFIDFLKV